MHCFNMLTSRDLAKRKLKIEELFHPSAMELKEVVS